MSESLRQPTPRTAHTRLDRAGRPRPGSASLHLVPDPSPLPRHDASDPAFEMDWFLVAVLMSTPAARLSPATA
jgi:hypothetical protein